MYKRSSWEFNQEVSQQFEEHVRKSLPFYPRLQEMIASLSDYFVAEQAVIYDLGCATGETIYQIEQRHKDKGLQYIGIDCSEEMIQRAKEKTKQISTASFYATQLQEYSFVQKSPFIVSILTLQFLPVYQRKMVLERVYHTLHEGGCFLLVEKTYSQYAMAQQLFTHLHYDDKASMGFTEQEILLKEQSLRGVLTPLTVQQNLNLLQQVGFETELFFKDWHFVGFMATKPIQTR